MQASKPKINRATLVTAAVLGAVIAISGMHHGYFEILQGNTSSEYNIIQSIGPDHRNWSNGEEVFTLIPNYLITGIISVITSVFIIVWSLRFLHTSFGPTIFLLLYIFLTLTGGGIVHLLFFMLVWLYSMRIRRKLSWRGRPPSGFTVSALSASWIPMLTLTSVLFIAALEITMFGIRGASDQTIYATIISLHLSSLLCLNLAFLAAISRDIRASTVIA